MGGIEIPAGDAVMVSLLGANHDARLEAEIAFRGLLEKFESIKLPPVMSSYHVSSTTSARPDTVWRLLIDGRSWPRWSSGIDELVEGRSSGVDPHGRDDVGTVRVFRSGRSSSPGSYSAGPTTSPPTPQTSCEHHLPLGLPASTVHAVLVRCRVNRLWLHPHGLPSSSPHLDQADHPLSGNRVEVLVARSMRYLAGEWPVRRLKVRMNELSELNPN